MRKGFVKVPMVMQMEALECGAASLAMILAFYGKWLPLEQVRADCGVSRDGSNARNLLRAARSYGLKGQGYRYEPEALRESRRFPCIIHWNFNHFVVLDGFTKDQAVLNDPARGVVKVSMREFDESFTGICLMFEPSEDFVRSGKPKSILRFARKRLEGTLVPVIFVIVTGIVTSLLSVINPAFSRVFLDRILTRENPDWLTPFLAFMGGAAILQLLVMGIQQIYMLKIQGKLAIVANSTFMWHVLRLPMEFFSQRMAGDIAQRQASSEGIASTLISELAPILLNFALLIVYLTVMLRYSLILALVGVCSVLLNVVVARLISQKRLNVTRVQMRDSGKLAGHTISGIEMIETIKANGAENSFFERWAGYLASVNTQSVRFARVNHILGAAPAFLQGVSGILVLTLGAFLTLRGAFSAGMILAFQGLLTAFMEPAEDLTEAGQTVQEMRANMERVEDVMQYPPDVNYASGGEPETADYAKLTGRLEMKDVTFGYSKLGAPLIEHFSMTLEPGQRIAFVGPSGCGKSTLAKLISGLYRPWSGEILFDGKPIDQIPRPVFTGSVAVVDQDITLFADTISANIKMWDDSIADFEMILSARDAHLHEDIMQRDGGYAYKMLEGGKDFSGGQCQRLEIARTLAQDPTLIVLDEATSALDARTEFDVIESIRARGLSCVVIAHRLSTIRDCDEIIVMEQGKVIERGKHDELYAQEGLYARLISND